MANTNKISFSVSVTPKILMDNADGVNQEIEVINENVRTTVGGGGEITANSGDTTVVGGWANGVNTAVSSGGTEYAVDANTDMVFFKHTGLLFGTSTSAAAADTVKVGIHGDDTTGVSGDAVFIAEILSGEAFLLPRPAFGITWKLASGSAAVGVEVLILST
tara:strand:- start:127 stop:612 length:486 start_codon:yes stop_codon:yes gene_type:complete